MHLIENKVDILTLCDLVCAYVGLNDGKTMQKCKFADIIMKACIVMKKVSTRLNECIV